MQSKSFWFLLSFLFACGGGVSGAPNTESDAGNNADVGPPQNGNDAATQPPTNDASSDNVDGGGPMDYTAPTDVNAHAYSVLAAPAENIPSTDPDFIHTSSGGICNKRSHVLHPRDWPKPLVPNLLVVSRGDGRGWIRDGRVDVRIIAATRRNLDQEVQAGHFRDDLFFRLAVGRVELPPLRERTGDIALLAHHFWKVLGGEGALLYDLQRRYEGYAWPGNVRELHNEIARRIEVGDVEVPAPRPSQRPGAPTRDYVDEVVAQKLPFTRARDRVEEEFVRRYVENALREHDGNITRAAGIALRYFQVLRARQSRKR